MRWLMVGLFAVALGVGAPAWSAGPTPPMRTTPPKDRKPVIANPDWAALPSPDDIARFYPEHAARNGISGRATIGCAISVDGRLVDCTVVSESPPGEDFGAAALRMAPYFQMKPKTRDGAPVEGGLVRIPIVFQAPDEPTVISSAGPPPEPPPLTGRFVFAGTESAQMGPGQDLTVLNYLRLADAAPTNGQTQVWILVMFPEGSSVAPGKPMYWMMQETFDCPARKVQAGPVLLYLDPDQPAGWGRPTDNSWAPPDTSATIRALELACGVAKPEGAPLESIAAVRVDATGRFAAVGPK